MADDDLDLDLLAGRARAARKDPGDWAMDYGIDVPALIDALRSTRDMLVQRDARIEELWDRESLAMRQRDAAEDRIEKVFQYCVDSDYADINPYEIAELIGRAGTLEQRRAAVWGDDD